MSKIRNAKISKLELGERTDSEKKELLMHYGKRSHYHHIAKTDLQYIDIGITVSKRIEEDKKDLLFLVQVYDLVFDNKTLVLSEILAIISTWDYYPLSNKKRIIVEKVMYALKRKGLNNESYRKIGI